jgi:hypothetical protein
MEKPLVALRHWDLHVVVKGGHLKMKPVICCTTAVVRTHISAKFETVCTHGAGCTFRGDYGRTRERAASCGRREYSETFVTRAMSW